MARRALLLLFAAGAPRASCWAPILPPANASYAFVRAGASVDGSAFILAPAPVACGGPGAVFGGFGGAGARLTTDAGVGWGQLYLRGSINTTAGWTVLADLAAAPVSPAATILSEGFIVVVHNDPRGAGAIGGSFSCLAYTTEQAGPQPGVSGCTCPHPIAPSLAVAVSLYTGCMRLGIGGRFESDYVCPQGRNPIAGGAANFTLRVAYLPAPPTISGGLFSADGSPVPGVALRVPLARPLDAIVAGPRASVGVGAAGGYYLTALTVAAVGVFTDAPLNLSLAASASAPPSGTLPSASFGDVAGPLAAAVAAAAALLAGALAACHFFRRARARAAGGGGDGLSDAFLPPTPSTEKLGGGGDIQ